MLLVYKLLQSGSGRAEEKVCSEEIFHTSAFMVEQF